MKKTILALIVLIACLSCNNKDSNTFSIVGKIDGYENDKELYLSYLTLSDGKWKDITDTTTVVNGEFRFNGNVDELTSAHLSFDNITSLLFFLEPTDIKVYIDMQNPQGFDISGLSVDKEYAEFRNILLSNFMIQDSISNSIQDLFYEMDSYQDNQNIIDSIMINVMQLKSELVNISAISDSLQLDFLSNNNTYQIAPYILYSLSRGNYLNSNNILELYNKLPEESRTSLLVKQLELQMEENILSNNQIELSIGDIAPDFTTTDIEGNEIKLSNLRDKNLRPLHDNPHVLTTYSFGI